MQIHAIPCNTMQYHAIPCNTMQYNAIPCNTMQYRAILCNTMPNYAIQCRTMQYHAIPWNTMKYHAIPCIMNNCCRSVLLPCGQIDGHFFNLAHIYNSCQRGMSRPFWVFCILYIAGFYLRGTDVRKICCAFSNIFLSTPATVSLKRRLGTGLIHITSLSYLLILGSLWTTTLN